MKSRYKCTDHKIDFACLGCVKAHMAERDRLLRFVRSIVETGKEDENLSCHYYIEEAREVLKELGREQ